jgi:hypothetical protein
MKHTKHAKQAVSFSWKSKRTMRNCLFRIKAKFRETASLFRETRNLFRFVFREIRNETSFAGNPSLNCQPRFTISDKLSQRANKIWNSWGHSPLFKYENDKSKKCDLGDHYHKTTVYEMPSKSHETILLIRKFFKKSKKTGIFPFGQNNYSRVLNKKG